MSILLELFLTFVKIGLFTFGGGYAMISLIENSCVEKKKWITHDEMMNVTVIAESTPGPIAINCATYVGYKKAVPRIIMIGSFGVMLLINIFSWNFSTISLMLLAAVVSMVIFLLQGSPKQKGGLNK